MIERRALVVEVDAATQVGLLGSLQARGYQCLIVSSSEEALEALADGSFSVTLVDLSSNDSDPDELIQRLKRHGRNSGPIIALADHRDNGHYTVPLEVDAVLTKPLSLDELQQAMEKFVRPQPEALGSASEQMGGRLRREMELWCSPKMLEASQILREAARVDVTVLVTGETGTGKELIAHAIHHFSSRRAGPFVKVNCAAMPRELLESEMFGYERGAFTGAHKLKIGKFEAADRGTIFLDEIGDLHPALQAKLLHVLQDGEFSRIGGKSTLSVDVRVLENLIKRMIVLDDPSLTKIPLPDDGVDGERSPSSAVEPSLKEISRKASQAAEREAIAKMLERTGWNRVRAARALRISYRALLYKIKDARLDDERSSARSAS